MKQVKDKLPSMINQEEKEKLLKDLLRKFEDCCYIMISAIKTYRKTFGITQEDDK